MGKKFTVEIDAVEAGLTEVFIRQEMIDIITNEHADTEDRIAAIRIAKYYSGIDEIQEIRSIAVECGLPTD